MAAPHLDHPGEVSWWPGYAPVELAGPCDHGCGCLDSRTIAYGPDFRRYTLEECLACRCRAWMNERCRVSTAWLAPKQPVAAR